MKSRIKLKNRSLSGHDHVAWYIGRGRRGYLWLGKLRKDGYEEFITSLSYGQAKALHAFLGEHLTRENTDG